MCERLVGCWGFHHQPAEGSWCCRAMTSSLDTDCFYLKESALLFIPRKTTHRNETKNIIWIILSLIKMPSSSLLIFLFFTFTLCFHLFHVPLIFNVEKDSSYWFSPDGTGCSNIELIMYTTLQSEVNRDVPERTGLYSRAGRNLFSNKKIIKIYLFFFFS